MARSQEMFAVTRINAKTKEQRLMSEGMTYGDALGIVMWHRHHASELRKRYGAKEVSYYYRMGRPHSCR